MISTATWAPGSAPALALLDLDGTLTDSAPGIVASMRATLTDLGLPVPDDAALRRNVGPPLPQSLVANGVPPHRVPEGVAIYRAHFRAGGMLDNSVYRGVPEALDALVAAGVRLVVATSKPEVYARQIVAHFGLDAHLDGGVDGVFGADHDAGERSSKAAVIGHALATLASRGRPAPAADAVVMVGDRQHDVHGARAHGIATIGAGWGYGSGGELEAAGALAVVDAPRLLPAVLLPAISGEAPEPRPDEATGTAPTTARR